MVSLFSFVNFFFLCYLLGHLLCCGLPLWLRNNSFLSGEKYCTGRGVHSGGSATQSSGDAATGLGCFIPWPENLHLTPQNSIALHVYACVIESQHIFEAASSEPEAGASLQSSPLWKPMLLLWSMTTISDTKLLHTCKVLNLLGLHAFCEIS